MNIQAFIFCGEGHDLRPFTRACRPEGSTGNPAVTGEKHDAGATGSTENGSADTTVPVLAQDFFPHVPKALLPVANKPLIEYVLDWCDQGNFKEMNIVAHVDEIDVIRTHLGKFLALRQQQFELIGKALSANMHSHHLQEPKPINFIATRCRTTGESLYKDILDHVVDDFLLLPCDFITDIPPQILIDQFQNRDSDNLALAVYHRDYIDAPEKSKKRMAKQFFTVYSPNEDNDKQPVLLDFYSKEDVTKTKYLQIRPHLLWKYPNSTVSTKLINSFIYFCSFELCQLLKQNLNINPKINGNSDKDQSAWETDDISSQHTNEFEDDHNKAKGRSAFHLSYLRKQNQLIADPLNQHKPLSKIIRDLARRSWKHSKPRETIGICIIPEPSFFTRANNLSSWMEASRFVLKIKASAANNNVQTTAGSASAIGADSMVDNTVTLLEKSNVKMSAIGANCKIGNRCRIVGTLLMNDVELGDDVSLENVILGPGVKVGNKSKLTNCYVEGAFVISSRSTFKGETLINAIEEIEDYSENMSSSMTSSEEDDVTDEDGDLNYEEEPYEDDGLFDR